MLARVLLWLVLPSTASGHGVAMHTASSKEEVLAAAQHAHAFVQNITATCAKELVICTNVTDWHLQSECLVEHEGELSWDCRIAVLNMVRHMPHAKLVMDDAHAELEMSGPDFDVSVTDIGHKTFKGCNFSYDALPYVWSYHIHFMWNELTDSTTKAMQEALHEKFVKEFAPNIKYCHKFSFLTDLWNKDSVTGPDGHEFAETCMFPYLPPGGPFFLWERGYLISQPTFHKVVTWLAANRPRTPTANPYDKKANYPIGILIHPNTGCQYNDLNHWSMWVGESKPLFFDILRGCVWAACEDHVMGCIAFNHIPKDEGYGTCYKAPTSMTHECTMSLEKTSNTSTMDCKKPSLSIV